MIVIWSLKLIKNEQLVGDRYLIQAAIAFIFVADHSILRTGIKIGERKLLSVIQSLHGILNYYLKQYASNSICGMSASKWQNIVKKIIKRSIDIFIVQIKNIDMAENKVVMIHLISSESIQMCRYARIKGKSEKTCLRLLVYIAVQLLLQTADKLCHSCCSQINVQYAIIDHVYFYYSAFFLYFSLSASCARALKEILYLYYIIQSKHSISSTLAPFTQKYFKHRQFLMNYGMTLIRLFEKLRFYILGRLCSQAGITAIWLLLTDSIARFFSYLILGLILVRLFFSACMYLSVEHLKINYGMQCRLFDPSLIQIRFGHMLYSFSDSQVQSYWLKRDVSLLLKSDSFYILEHYLNIAGRTYIELQLNRNCQMLVVPRSDQLVIYVILLLERSMWVSFLRQQRLGNTPISLALAYSFFRLLSSTNMLSSWVSLFQEISNISRLFRCDISDGMVSILDLLSTSAFKFYSYRMGRSDFRLARLEAYISCNWGSLVIFQGNVYILVQDMQSSFSFDSFYICMGSLFIPVFVSDNICSDYNQLNAQGSVYSYWFSDRLSVASFLSAPIQLGADLSLLLLNISTLRFYSLLILCGSSVIKFYYRFNYCSLWQSQMTSGSAYILFLSINSLLRFLRFTIQLEIYVI